MASNYSSSRRASRPQSGRRRGPKSPRPSSRTKAPKKAGFFGKLLSLFGIGEKKAKGRSKSTARLGDKTKNNTGRRTRTTRKPEPIEVTTPRLYVGNLSFDTSESDLFELFNGFGKVQNVELVCHRDTHRSKGFGFVQMTIIEEAKRAAEELHDKEYMGRKLVVSGARALPERAERSQEVESTSNETETYEPSSEEESCGSCCEH